MFHFYLVCIPVLFQIILNGWPTTKRHSLSKKNESGLMCLQPNQKDIKKWVLWNIQYLEVSIQRAREREQIGSNNWQYIEQGSKSTEMPIIVGFGPTMEFQTVLSCLLACFNIFIFLAQYYDVRRVYRTINIMICNKLMFSSLIDRLFGCYIL